MKMLLVVGVMMASSFANAASTKQALLCNLVGVEAKTKFTWDQQIIVTLQDHQASLDGKNTGSCLTGIVDAQIGRNGASGSYAARYTSYQDNKGCKIDTVRINWAGQADKIDTTQPVQVISDGYTGIVTYGVGHYRCSQIN